MRASCIDRRTEAAAQRRAGKPAGLEAQAEVCCRDPAAEEERWRRTADRLTMIRLAMKVIKPTKWPGPDAHPALEEEQREAQHSY